jgi:uncharacterized protein
MQPLKLKDRAIFNRYLKLRQPELAVFSFVNIFIWRDFFDFSWEVIDGNLCLFAEDKIGCFLYLPPLGKRFSGKAVERCFAIMDAKNRDQNISRIENVEPQDCPTYQRLGFKAVLKSHDYLYRRSDLVALSGNAYKPKRAAVNYFQKNFQYRYLTFRKEDIKECLRLYAAWQKERTQRYDDRIYRQMLSDSLRAQKTALEDFQKLGLVGRVVKIKNRIRAYTFGFQLNKNTFCVLFEVADLKIRGLANFIFREFCQEATGTAYINCMDDSGLENLKKTKLSFRPCRLIPAYIAARK